MKLTFIFAFVVFFHVSLAVSLPELFNQPWEDLSIFEHDLVSSYQAPNQSLPDLSIYHLDLSLSDDLSQVTGKEELLYRNSTGQILSELVFRLYPNVLGSQLLVKRVEIDGVLTVGRLEHSGSVLRIFLPKALAPNEQTIIAMQFTTQVGQGSESYGRLALYSEALSLAHAYPVLAPFKEGDWLTDTPSPLGDPSVLEAAYYLVRVSAPVAQTLVASGSLINLDETGDRQTAVFSTGPAREFYLASVTGYVQLSQMVGETLINIYLPERFDHAAGVSLEYAAKALERFNQLIPYPYRELDIVAMPVLASGIEFPGIFTLTNRLFTNPAGSLESVLVHETAHQWSYNLVGNDQVLEPWLDEALAQYLTLLYHRSYDSPQFVEGYLDFWNATWHEATDPLEVIGEPVSYYDDYSYSGIVYGRGLFFFLVLEQEIGTDGLERALSQYYEQYRWDFVSGEALKTELELVCKCDLSELFDRWVDKKY
ncbi:MAG: M1 family metallopeptidase [Trueperaceae bacterium]|nr:M1 family metallopeptidase [Trueperaceae bacterium]